MKIALRPIALMVGLTALPLAVFAHFKLLEPAEWVKTNDPPRRRNQVRADCRIRMERQREIPRRTPRPR